MAKMEGGETSDDVRVADRISQLPEPILHHILSFLEVKDAFRACVLSKNLNTACATLQFLNFGKFFPAPITANNDPVHFLQKSMEVLNVVDEILMRRKQLNVGIQKFSLELPRRIDELDLQPFVNKFITSVTEKNRILEELEFKVGDYANASLVYSDPPLYTLPEVVYDAESLVKLHLEEFTLGFPSSGTIKLYSLRELHLFRVFVDNDLFQLLLTGCPRIEILSTNQIKGLDRVHIYGLCNLKRIKMCSCFRGLVEMKIEAPNLEYLDHHGVGVGAMYVADVTACKNLKHLTLDNIVINDEWMVELLTNLPFLEEFNVFGCWGLKIFRISSNRLRTLSLRSCNNLEEIEVNAPHLYSFDYGGDISLSISLIVPAIENMCFLIGSKINEIHSQEKLIEFLRNFNHCKEMKLVSRFGAVELIIPKELREVLHPPLYDIKHLIVALYTREDTIMDLLDSLLWIAPGLDTLSINSSMRKVPRLQTQTQIQIQFTYKTSINEDENSSCSLTAQKRGLNTLKKVQFVDFKEADDHWGFKNYFVEMGIEFEGL